MTPTHHHVSYEPGNGTIEGDGDNAPGQNVTVDWFNADPTTIDQGGSSTLSWATSNASRVYIDNSIGDVAGDGSHQVWPGSTTTYTLTAEGTNGPVSQQVTVTVNPPPPDDVRIDYFTADPGTIQSGGSSTLSWGTTNATSVTLDGGGVNATGSQVVQPSSTTAYTLEAQGSNGPVSQQVTVTVETGGGPVTVPFRMNCGPSAQDSGWASDDTYVSGGNDYLFDGGVDKSGVTDPAPDGVYLSVRHAEPAFDVPIANGSYKVRLHFLDAYGDDSVDGRAMNVTIEGVEVLSAYSVKAAAGGTSKATVEEFDVTVGDGSLTILLDSGSGNDAFLSGAEVLEPGAPPPVSVLTTIVVTPPSTTIYASNTCTLDADTLDQNGAPFATTVSWSVSGGGWMSGSTFTSDGTPGTFTVTASSGGVSGTASVTVEQITDTDSDGMDDAWEVEYFNDLSQGASDDYDDDGYSNLAEFNADTDPTNALSTPGTSSVVGGFSCSAGGGAAAGLALVMLAAAAALRMRALRPAARRP
jgi:hypothetical protein